MDVLGRLPAEKSVEQQVLGSRRDPLFAADDMADAHLVIIDDYGQVVGWKAV